MIQAIITADVKENTVPRSNSSCGKSSPLALTEVQVAEIIGCSLSRLRQDRHHARGLPYVKWGRSVRYLWEDLKKYLEERRITHHVQ